MGKEEESDIDIHSFSHSPEARMKRAQGYPVDLSMAYSPGRMVTYPTVRHIDGEPVTRAMSHCHLYINIWTLADRSPAHRSFSSPRDMNEWTTTKVDINTDLTLYVTLPIRL